MIMAEPTKQELSEAGRILQSRTSSKVQSLRARPTPVELFVESLSNISLHGADHTTAGHLSAIRGNAA
jgi:hypothetical protein